MGCMRTRTWMLTAIAAVFLLGGWGLAQVGDQHRVQPPITVMGDDVGFRIEGYKGDTVLGTLVVRVNGKWVDTQLTVGGLRRLTVE